MSKSHFSLPCYKIINLLNRQFFKNYRRLREFELRYRSIRIKGVAIKIHQTLLQRDGDESAPLRRNRISVGNRQRQNRR